MSRAKSSKERKDEVWVVESTRTIHSTGNVYKSADTFWTERNARKQFDTMTRSWDLEGHCWVPRRPIEGCTYRVVLYRGSVSYEAVEEYGSS